MNVNELEIIIRKSLTEFCAKVFNSNWFGKEREAVNLYTFGYLLKQCGKSNILRDPTQICIESRVPSLKKLNTKREVSKDLVIWPHGGQTCWNINDSNYNFPISILEWKANVTELDQRDLKWMIEYSKQSIQFIGFVISFDLKGRKFKLKANKILKGKEFRNWLLIQ